MQKRGDRFSNHGAGYILFGFTWQITGDRKSGAKIRMIDFGQDDHRLCLQSHCVMLLVLLELVPPKRHTTWLGHATVKLCSKCHYRHLVLSKTTRTTVINISTHEDGSSIVIFRLKSLEEIVHTRAAQRVTNNKGIRVALETHSRCLLYRFVDAIVKRFAQNFAYFSAFNYTKSLGNTRNHDPEIDFRCLLYCN